jgi:hypothetical protein
MRTAQQINNIAKKFGQKPSNSMSVVRRATGPRTKQGKQRSKNNALKHGIFSNVAVLPGESQAEFNNLLADYCDDFQPVGAFEDDLVEMLVVHRWRLRRLIIAENAEIQAGSEFIEWDQKDRQLIEASEIQEVCYNGGLIARIANPRARDSCLRLLVELKNSMRKEGFSLEDDKSKLTIVYGKLDPEHWETNLFNSYSYWSTFTSVSNEIGKELECPSPEECKEYFIKELDDEIKRLKQYKKEQISVEASRTKLEKLRQSVPDSPRMDALLRYAASLERAFDRTLSQLERVQRMRRGQPVPPRFELEVK